MVELGKTGRLANVGKTREDCGGTAALKSAKLGGFLRKVEGKSLIFKFLAVIIGRWRRKRRRRAFLTSGADRSITFTERVLP